MTPSNDCQKPLTYRQYMDVWWKMFWNEGVAQQLLIHRALLPRERVYANVLCTLNVVGKYSEQLHQSHKQYNKPYFGRKVVPTIEWGHCSEFVSTKFIFTLKLPKQGSGRRLQEEKKSCLY